MESDELERRRNAMIQEIVADTKSLRHLTELANLDPRVVAAMRTVPRHLFVSDTMCGSAYINHALPIGCGQTISQPFIVALMSSLLELDASDRVLEIGTGSGYQAAILAEIAESVYSIEVVEELALEARQRLRELNYKNIFIRVGDGYDGWPEHAPYDAIIVTAAAEAAPTPLIQQLDTGGCLVIPLGTSGYTQWLTVITKNSDGRTASRSVLPVAFVPFKH